MSILICISYTSKKCSLFLIFVLHWKTEQKILMKLLQRQYESTAVHNLHHVPCWTIAEYISFVIGHICLTSTNWYLQRFHSLFNHLDAQSHHGVPHVLRKVTSKLIRHPKGYISPPSNLHHAPCKTIAEYINFVIGHICRTSTNWYLQRFQSFVNHLDAESHHGVPRVLRKVTSKLIRHSKSSIS